MTGDTKNVEIYTDGACIGNPGPGGYGIVLLYGQRRKEVTGGYRMTTNNRMEILAAIVGLELLKTPCKVTVYSDSLYLVDGMMKGWVQQWRTSNWHRKGGKIVPNADLWARLLHICAAHEVTFIWVQGHAGQPENERCDRLSIQAAQSPNLAIDEEYERMLAVKQSQQSIFGNEV